ncbi:MAG: ABC transporter ATP-binding protein [Bacteroidota bacterium]
MLPTIRVENLSKQYRLGQVGTSSIKDDWKRFWYGVRGKENPFLMVGEVNDRTSKGNSEYIWALQDISFNVMPGDVLGIIGRNGAGKSTLLKILSRVTQPTTGRLALKGRVASLLEVGTGMHPDLTGRENVYLNGAILGMKRKEIDRQFDEIVAFSGVERYIDTPVKRYSSGMHVRLGFAVAAHLEPDILIVDEVLAVGDAEFQKKCLGKMKEASESQGRTVLFVSHNLNAIQRLCNSCILMHHGQIKDTGTTEYVLNKYLEEGISLLQYEGENKTHKKAYVSKAWCEGTNAIPTNELKLNEKWKILVEVILMKPIPNFVCACGLSDLNGTPINTTWTNPVSLGSGKYLFEFLNHQIVFASGKYLVTIGLSNNAEVLEYVEHEFGFDITEVGNEIDVSIKNLSYHSGLILNRMMTSFEKIHDFQN